MHAQDSLGELHRLSCALKCDLLVVVDWMAIMSALQAHLRVAFKQKVRFDTARFTTAQGKVIFLTLCDRTVVKQVVEQL